MKQKINACIAIACFLSISANAQTFKGKTINAFGEPLPYANVCLLNHVDSSFIQGAVTNDKGEFVINSEQREGIIKVSLIGYQTIYKKSTDGYIGSILMVEDTTMLGEVTVKGTRPTTQLKNDALVTHVQGSSLAHSGSARDVLGKTPSVMKSNDGIEVLGKGTPLIYINGRLMRNQAELDQLTSDKIKDVEVVTTPGAAYDASVNAVIRIKTLKPVGEGFSMDSRTQMGLTHYLFGKEELNFNYRFHGLDIFGMVGYDYNKYRQQNISQQYTYAPSNVLYQTADAKRYAKSNMPSGKIGLNYMFNENHFVGILYDISYLPSKIRNNSFTALEIDKILSNEVSTESEEKSHSRKHLVSGYYSGKMGKWGIDLNMDALWDNADTHQDVVENATLLEDRTISTQNDINNKLYAAKAVATYPIWRGQLAFGTEWSFLHRTDEYVSGVEYINDSHSKIKETNGTGFAEIRQTLGELNVSAGLRYEHVVSNYFENGVKMDEQSRVYHHLFPSAMLSMPIGHVRTRLSYSRKITRPAFSQLSSNVQYINRYTYQSGNPNLRPSIRDYVELMANYKWLTLMANYTHVKDYMMSVYNQYGESPEIALIQKQNVNGYSELSGMINVSPSFGKYHPSLMVAVRQQFLTIKYRGEDLKLNKPMGILRFNNAYNLPFDAWLNADFSWRTSGNAENMYIGNTWQCDLGLYKAFAHDKWSIKLQCEDLLNTAKSTMTLKNDIREMSLRKFLDTRKFSITVTYKINATHSKYKGTGAGEDVKNRL